jgi:hypothetical protein
MLPSKKFKHFSVSYEISNFKEGSLLETSRSDLNSYSYIDYVLINSSNSSKLYHITSVVRAIKSR